MVRIKKWFFLVLKPLSIYGSMVLMVYGYISSFIDAPPIIHNWRTSFGIGLSWFVVVMFWDRVDLYRRYVWWAKPVVEMIPHRQPRYVEGNWIAQLEIKNKEEIDITDCYATLEVADGLYFRDDTWKSSPLVPFLSNKPSRIVWDEDEESYDLCKITIPLENSRHINIVGTQGSIHFKLCGDKKLELNYMLGETISTFRIRIDGKFNTKGMKPLYFDGYVRHRLKPVYFTSSDLDNEYDVKEGSSYIPYIVFGEGDWKKDEEVKKDIEAERIEYKKWVEKNKKRIDQMNEETK